MDISIGGVKVHAKGRCLFYFIFLKRKRLVLYYKERLVLDHKNWLVLYHKKGDN